MTKAQAGSLGGKTTVARYGPDYMRTIGKKGAQTLWRRYALYPFELSKYAMVDRATGQIVAIR